MSEDSGAADFSQDGLQERLADALSEMGYSVDREAGRYRSGIELTIEDSSGRTIAVNVRDRLTPDFLQETFSSLSAITCERVPWLIVTAEEIASSTVKDLTGLGKVWVIRWRGDADSSSLAAEVQSILETAPFYTDRDKRLQALLGQLRAN